MKRLEGIGRWTWSSSDHFQNLHLASFFLLAASQFWCCADNAGKHKLNGWRHFIMGGVAGHCKPAMRQLAWHVTTWRRPFGDDTGMFYSNTFRSYPLMEKLPQWVHSLMMKGWKSDVFEVHRPQGQKDFPKGRLCLWGIDDNLGGRHKTVINKEYAWGSTSPWGFLFVLKLWYSQPRNDLMRDN